MIHEKQAPRRLPLSPLVRGGVRHRLTLPRCGAEGPSPGCFGQSAAEGRLSLKRYEEAMDQVTLTLPDGSQKQASKGTLVHDFIRAQIGQGLAKAAGFAKLDGAPVDLTRPPSCGG